MIPEELCSDSGWFLLIEPYKKRKDRNVIIRAGKFYLFDVGIAGPLSVARFLRKKESISERQSNISF